MREEIEPSRVREMWNECADAWDEFVEGGLDYLRTEFHGPALLAACGDVEGLDVLEAGCGQGWFCRRLAERGARVTGVDWAAGALDLARRREEASPLGVEYAELDAARVAERFPAGSFDLATGCMSLQDMPDPLAVLSSLREVLAPDGRVVLSLPHPATDTPYREWARDDAGTATALMVDRYFESGPQELRWDMARLSRHWTTVTWHRTISDWFGIADGAGLAIRRLEEPRPTEEQVRANPALRGARRLPYLLILHMKQR